MDAPACTSNGQNDLNGGLVRIYLGLDLRGPLLTTPFHTVDSISTSSLGFRGGLSVPIFLQRATVLCLLLCAAVTAHPQTASNDTHRIPQFENDAVKVWRTVIQPGTPLPLHHHDHPRVLVALTPGTLKIVEQSGSTQTLILKVGEAYWLPAMPPGALHQDINATGQPIEVMVVELEKEK